MLQNLENPTVARLRAAHMLLQDLEGNPFGDPSDIASKALSQILDMDTKPTERVDDYDKVLQIVKKWDKDQDEQYLGIRQINTDLEEKYGLKKDGNLQNTKRALQQLGWVVKVEHGNKLWFRGD